MTKVCVYAITKNEEQFVERWMKSMSEADYVVVLDTGSTDNTVEELRKHGAIVGQKIIDPWRFDVARNESMELIPSDADVCVCTDLDEIFDPGWADTLREHWVPGTTEKAKYLYSWSHDENDRSLIQIWYEKVHANTDDWYWAMPVHEALTHRSKNDRDISMIYLPEDSFHLHHYPDLSKSRGQYLDLMRMGIDENPDCFMQNWYYGRELYFHKRYRDAIDQLEYVKTMKYRGFEYQRAASLTFLGHAYKMVNDSKGAEENYLIAANMMNNVREPMLFLTQFYYEQQRWYACVDAGLRTLAIDYTKGAWYEDSRNYKEKPHDYLSIAYWNIGDIEKGRYHIEKALEYDPNNERLHSNYKYFV